MPTKFGKCSPQPHSCFCCWPCRLIVVLRMGRSSVYLWVLPMFHACGWTYPWAITFAFGAQVSSCSLAITHVADLISLKDHAADCGHHLLSSGVTHYCAAPTVQVRCTKPLSRLETRLLNQCCLCTRFLCCFSFLCTRIDQHCEFARG